MEFGLNFIENFLNRLRASNGYQQSFEEKVQAGDIDGALSLMETHNLRVAKAIQEYDMDKHQVMQRQDKPVFDAKGHFKGWVKRWKLALGYHQYINEIALVFMYGRPVKWTQESDNTDKAFEAYTKFIKDTHFNSKVREAKRLAGSETQSALLFHCYRGKDGKAKCLIKVLAKSLGDDLYFIRDQYDRLLYFARGYYLTEAVGGNTYHVDIYMDDVIYHCKRGGNRWVVEQEKNFIGKKPVILFEQEVEWHGAQPLMDRQEMQKSKTADVNDYFADPALVATADVVQGMPDKDSEVKLYILSNGKGKLEYLTPDTASELKKQEMEDNERHIMRDTFTPNIDVDSMLKLTNVSAKALRQLMVLATIKADHRKEKHEEYMTRTSSLILAIMQNVTNIELAGEISQLEVGHEFQEPFMEDVAEVINNLTKARDAGGLSEETLVEMNPLIHNTTKEKARIKQEQEQKQEKEAQMFKQDMFNPTE